MYIFYIHQIPGLPTSVIAARAPARCPRNDTRSGSEHCDTNTCTSSYVSIRQHTYVSTRQHTSAYVMRALRK